MPTPPSAMIQYLLSSISDFEPTSPVVKTM